MDHKFGAWIIYTIVIGLVTATPLKLDDDNDEFIGSMVLDEVPLVDGHNDLAMNFYEMEQNRINDFDFDTNLKRHSVWGVNAFSQTDLPRLREGKLGGQFWVAGVYCEDEQNKDAVERTLEQIDVIKRLIVKYSNDFMYTTTAQGIWDAFRAGKIASLIAIESGHAIDNRLAVLRLYYELGVRYMTLTHNCDLPWADASLSEDDPNAVKRNLTDFGRSIIDEMNRLGMMIDLSHASHGLMSAVLDRSIAPVIFSHSNAYSLQPHHRNVRDDILKRLVINKGIVMVNFYQGYIGGKSIFDLINHLNYIKEICGPDHVGIGSDFDGINDAVEGLEDVSTYPELFDKLAESGHGYEPWTREELRKLAGENIIRVFQDVEKVRDQMKQLKVPTNEMIIPYDDLVQSGQDLSCRSDVK